jgi:hypothetical protein
MKLVAPPLYVLTTQTLDKNKGVEVLTRACEACTAAIEQERGRLVVKEAARAVSERDDRCVLAVLATLTGSNWRACTAVSHISMGHHSMRVLACASVADNGGLLPVLAVCRCRPAS